MTDPDRDDKTYSSRRKWIELVLLIAVSTTVMFVLSSIALLIYTSGSREPTVHVLDIPPGSWDLIEQGENPLKVPPTWSFYADDTLVLDNRDDVAHTLGAWFVPPNTVRRFELQPAYGGFFSCSLHPSGGITLDIQPRNYNFSIIAFPVLGFGFSVGFILWIGLNVMRSLDKEPDLSEYLQTGDRKQETGDDAKTTSDT
ncbi:MAG: hypothetical protein DRJ28_05815 [Actinobacteria bacterium]|nr:MAG: hypothetical protein DRJ28_05815 [Actinomycetota bacterium]